MLKKIKNIVALTKKIYALARNRTGSSWMATMNFTVKPLTHFMGKGFSDEL